jgi:hypothetical protein
VPPLLAEAALGGERCLLLAGDRRDDVDSQVPALPRRELDGEADQRAVGLAVLGEDHLRPRRAAAVLLEHELVAVGVEAHGGGRRQRSRVQRVAEREVVLLHRDDVREVGADEQLDGEGDGLGALVPHRDVVLHADADEALAHDREHVLLEAAREGVAEVERRREVLDLAGREQQRPLAVHAQLEPREEPGVVGEEARREAAQVADLVADAERRPLEDGESHRPTRGGSGLLRTGRAP